VLFRNAHVVPGLRATLEACDRHGAELLVDAYHALNAIDWTLPGEGLEGAFAVGGGYKYCQLGEGNCFLRVPPGRDMRPAITGWFAEFATLEESTGSRVAYGEGPTRWAGATYDPTSHYRAAAVLDFFDDAGLTPELLRRVSRHQVGLLAERFDALDLDPSVIDRDRSVSLEGIAGFLALRSPRAGELRRQLRERGVHCDHRDDVLRLGPAPYLHDGQLEAAMEALGEAATGP
ncbi:MAG: kynureninase, partial [Acidobacteriota bacterium]